MIRVNYRYAEKHPWSMPKDKQLAPSSDICFQLPNEVTFTA